VTLHEALQRHSSQSELCTVCLAQVVPRPAAAADVTIALAGHPPPLVIDRDGAPRCAGTPGTLLGISGAVRPGIAGLALERGETLLLYTDGVIDAGRPDNQLGEQGLLAEVASIRSSGLAELLERIERTAIERSRGAARDDLALLGLRVVEPR
jgi:serine phosphatase RsbU (regulator of sigma subunit)